MLESLRRLLVIAGLVAVLLLLVTGCGQSKVKGQVRPSQDLSQKPIRIGQIIDLSGLTADHGDYQNKAAELFLQEINAKGGLLGRPLQIITRDGKNSTPEAVNQARDLLYSQNVDFLMTGTNTAYALAVLDMAEQAKKIVFSQDSSNDFVKKGYRYAFRVPYLIAHMQGNAAAKYATEKFPQKKRYYLIAHDMAFGRMVVADFKKRIQELQPDVQIVGEAYVKPTETDYNPYITAILQAQPDIVFFAWQVGIPFYKQAAAYQLSQKVQLLSAYWGGVQDMMVLPKEELPVGAVVGGIPWYGIKTAENEAFVNAFKQKYGVPPKPTAYFEYVTLQVLAEAIRKAGSLETEKVIQVLESGLEVDTILGKVKMRGLDHQGTLPYYLGTVKWDDTLQMGVISDIIQLDTEQFLPSANEVEQMRKSK